MVVVLHYVLICQITGWMKFVTVTFTVYYVLFLLLLLLLVHIAVVYFTEFLLWICLVVFAGCYWKLYMHQCNFRETSNPFSATVAFLKETLEVKMRSNLSETFLTCDVFLLWNLYTRKYESLISVFVLFVKLQINIPMCQLIAFWIAQNKFCTFVRDASTVLLSICTNMDCKPIQWTPRTPQV